MHNTKQRYSAFIFIMMIYSLHLSASEIIGTIDKVKGNVKVKHVKVLKKQKVKDGDSLEKGDLLMTSKASFAVITLKDGSVFSLKESSLLRFYANNSIKQLDGKIYYKIKSRLASNRLKIETPFAIIGIKGTTFIINATSDEKSILLKEGKIGIESIHQEFLLYKQKINQAFDDFKNKTYSDFNNYKAKNSLYSSPVKIKEFDLSAQYKVSFNKNKVYEDPFEREERDTFKSFETFIKESKINK